MNNLLKSLAGSHIKSTLPESDLRLLLQTVKDGRRQTYDVKLADPFYDALEDLLHDLRTVTMDNHDAEAFLKPVSRMDVPDYYDVIPNPMDLQTMLKKVKQKSYKSKKEFKDDLDLIWSNCFTYNATENHPLRLCASRLKVKAERLLRNITDRKERADPSIPTDLSVRRIPHHKSNGINGHIRPVSLPIAPRPPSAVVRRPTPSITPAPTPSRRDLPFADSPAIVRTAEGMGAFSELDCALSNVLSSTNHTSGLEDRLRELLPASDVAIEYDDIAVSADGVLGDKRRLTRVSDHRPIKRVRLAPHPASSSSEPVELWWAAQQSDHMLGNSIPPVPFSSSSSASAPLPKRVSHTSKRKKKRPRAPPNPRSMLTLMNSNIKALRRLRQTHARFAALNVTAGSIEEGPLAPAEAIADEPVEIAELDEQPWSYVGARAAEGIDIGQQAGDQCLHWMNHKVLEHVGFQGSSSMALDVLSSIASEYLMNVGRTLRFYVDKYSNNMTSEEIILHTLFESGTSRIQELERYINDDVIRHGNRLNDLEKKLSNAYQEFTSTEALDDDALFANEDDEEEESAFVMGQFTDDIGEDFLGLRALGIAEELGLANLIIPKRLLKGKKNAKNATSTAKPAEPPPPYPPPPPFISLNSSTVDGQIGLLKPYYQHRISMLSTAYPQSSTHQHPPLIVLPDDPPHPSQSKIGPLGQVLKTNTAAGSTKKKSKAKDAANAASVPKPEASTPGLLVMSPMADSPMSPKKKKGLGGGTANGTGKKRGRPPEGMPPVVLASA